MTTHKPSAATATYGDHEIITPENGLRDLVSPPGRWSPAKKIQSPAPKRR
ncbi:MAG: hypothetical protein P8Y71_12330 [Pseudolabrys sp.]